MSRFAVAMSGIVGDETTAGYENAIRCHSMRHGIEMPLVDGANRGAGVSIHGSIMLGHDVDRASPSLRLACVGSVNIPDVTITRLLHLDAATRPRDIIKLCNVDLVQVFLNTPVEPEAGMPCGKPVEYIVLDYKEIQWEYLVYEAGVVAEVVGGSYDVARMGLREPAW